MRDQSHRELVSPETFVLYLNRELERYERYQRRFSLLLARSPEDGNASTREMDLHRASEAELRIVRACDLVCSFERASVLATLLPETGADGARVVFDRLREQVTTESAGWWLKMASYPEHADVIKYFLENAAGLFPPELPQFDDSVIEHLVSDEPTSTHPPVTPRPAKRPSGGSEALRA